ncbi:MAG: GrpB family protein [Rhodoglobus sp.]
MSVEVVSYSEEWPALFSGVAQDLRHALKAVPIVSIEHVGSTAVPGLAAKPILDIDIVVKRENVADAVAALTSAGYSPRGDLGVTDREAVDAPDQQPARHVYVCVEGTLHLRNHPAVRDVLRRRPDLRERYGAVKMGLAQDPDMDIAAYIAHKSEVLQQVLAVSDLSTDEKSQIFELNTRSQG